jgi:hypothetical protein
MGWWIALGILIGLLILPLGVSVFYDSEGVRARVIIGLIRFTVFPMKKKEKKDKKEKQAAPEKAAEQEKPKEEPAKETKQTPKADKPKKKSAPKQEDPGGSLLDFLPLVKLALKFVGEFFGKTLHIDVLYLKVTMAGGDPCDLAVNYGKAWAALGNLWPKLDDLMTIKKRDVRLQCDFEGDETLVNARVDITITLGRVLGLLICYGARIAWNLVKIRMNRKKAAEAEEKRRKKLLNTRFQ